MAVRFKTAETHPITRELAERFATMREIEAERSKKPARLAQLARLIESNTLKCFDWAVALLNGEEIRVNGGHTSHLLSRPNVSIPAGATAVIQYYEVDSQADLTSLWGMFDAATSSRNKPERLAIYAASVPELAGVLSETLLLTQAALIITKEGNCQAKMTIDERNEIVGQNVAYVRWFDELLRMDGKRRLFKKVGVAYAAYQVYQKSPTEGRRFWEEVVTGSNTLPTSGSRVLREYLMTRKHLRKEAGSKVWEETAKACLHCWNIWRRNGSLKQLRTLLEIPAAV